MVILIAISFIKTIWIINVEGDYFICYNEEKLVFQETKVRWDKKRKDYVIDRHYHNKNACLNCKFADECCNGNHRVVKITGGKISSPNDG